MAESIVSKAVRVVIRELDVLPDDLYDKSRTFHVELDEIKKALKKEFDKTSTKFSRRVRKKTKKEKL